MVEKGQKDLNCMWVYPKAQCTYTKHKLANSELGNYYHYMHQVLIVRTHLKKSCHFILKIYTFCYIMLTRYQTLMIIRFVFWNSYTHLSYPDGGYRNHVGDAHSHCYELLVC